MLTVAGEPPPDNGVGSPTRRPYRLTVGLQPQRRSTRRPSGKEPEFVDSDVHRRLDELRELGHPAVLVPLWCVHVTGNTVQALVLAQFAYWFSEVEDKANARHGLPRAAVHTTRTVVDDAGREYETHRHWFAISAAGLAKQCCVSKKQVERALEALVEAKIVLRADRRAVKQRQDSYDPAASTGRVCYRLSPAGIHRGLVRFLMARGLIGVDGDEYGYPLLTPWSEVEQTLLAEAATRNRTRAGQKPHAALGLDPDPDYSPTDAEEYRGSRVERVLRVCSGWVTVPHWVPRMTRSVNDALVLSKIWEWQPSLRRRHGGLLWLEKTHEQLAAETGLWPDTPESDRHRGRTARYDKVADALKRLREDGLVEVARLRRRVTGLRLLPGGLSRALDRLELEEDLCG